VRGDFSRVLQQQGRVSLDADFNEHGEIDRHRLRTLARDIIGPCGGPRDAAGFGITVDAGGRLVIGAGRYYVGGLMVENERDCPIDDQPDPPKAAVALAELTSIGGRQQLYLHVWERTITAAEDAELLEPALGGADTSVRLKAVWQVRFAAPDDDLECDERERATLDVRTGERGYVGLENRLYRVEVLSADGGGATFNWSRDNASDDWRKSPAVPIGDGWITLEDGIEVAFGGGAPKPGDYWLIPARPSTGGIEWPGGPQPAQRIEHNCCPLVVVEFDVKASTRLVIEDRRRLFAPLTG
jgi:hypothetical protein